MGGRGGSSKMSGGGGGGSTAKKTSYSRTIYSSSELKVGEEYSMRNPYDNSIEYGRAKYEGPTRNKYGEIVHLMSDGTLFEDRDIQRGVLGT